MPTLAELSAGQEADLFLLLSAKEELKTKTGKPYFRVGFRDATRELSFPIWSDAPLAADCREAWQPGKFYKLRAVYLETNFGPQLDIRKIREATDADAADGFDPTQFLKKSRFEPQAMFDELLDIAKTYVKTPALKKLVDFLLKENHDALLSQPAARFNHHSYVGGLLEHSLSVAKTCVFLADKYAAYYDDLNPPLDKNLVVAGGILHDLGKLHELKQEPSGTTHTPEGALIGHILIGRDMVRDAVAQLDMESEFSGDTLLRLEHLIISHQGRLEWGAAKLPMTLEAMLVHAADDIDARFQMMATIMEEDTTPGPVTSRKNVLMQYVYRGEPVP